MKPIIKELMLKPVKEYFLMTVGMIMYSFAWIGCILPAKGVGGGAAGLSLVLCHAVEEWLGVSTYSLYTCIAAASKVQCVSESRQSKTALVYFCILSGSAVINS